MRTQINVACCVIMTATCVFDVIVGQYSLAWYCGFVAVFAAGVAHLSRIINELKKRSTL